MVLKMLGLRKQEDSKFECFFELVQETAKKQGCVFFADCGEGREFATETMEGEDLSGWLIPIRFADRFEQHFLKDEIDEEWTDFVTFAIWHKTLAGIIIKFQNLD